MLLWLHRSIGGTLQSIIRIGIRIHNFRITIKLWIDNVIVVAAEVRVNDVVINVRNCLTYQPREIPSIRPAVLPRTSTAREIVRILPNIEQ